MKRSEMIKLMAHVALTLEDESDSFYRLNKQLCEEILKAMEAAGMEPPKADFKPQGKKKNKYSKKSKIRLNKWEPENEQ